MWQPHNRGLYLILFPYLDKSPDEVLKMGQRPNRGSKIVNSALINRVQELLTQEKDRKIHRKQRYTGKTLFLKMKEEGLFDGCERYFRKFLQKQRKIIGHQKNPPTTYLELNFPFGEYIQFDHGPLEIELNGERGASYLFCASVPGYCLRFCQIYKKKSQESWGYFHEEVFKFFKGIFKYSMYDNDSVLKNPKTGELTLFSCELMEHYGTEMVFCNKAKGNEKGAVENSVGTCRRLFLAGLPSFKTLEEANKYLMDKMINHTGSEKHYQTKEPLINYQNDIVNLLLPLKGPHEWGIWNELKVDKMQRIQFDKHFYSVPEKYVGSRLKVYITPINIIIYHDRKIIFNHLRCFKLGENSLKLDHYLDQLERKPRAITFSKVMQQEKFPDYIIEIRDRLRVRFGLDRGNIEVIRILKLKRLSSSSDFKTSVLLGLSYGGITFLAIKSFLDQLQVSQKSPLNHLSNLPDKLSTKNKIKFDLSPYGKLSKKGEESC